MRKSLLNFRTKSRPCSKILIKRSKVWLATHSQNSIRNNPNRPNGVLVAVLRRSLKNFSSVERRGTVLNGRWLLHLELQNCHMESSLQWVLVRVKDMRSKYSAQIVLWFLGTVWAYFSPREDTGDGYYEEACWCKCCGTLMLWDFTADRGFVWLEKTSKNIIEMHRCRMSNG